MNSFKPQYPTIVDKTVTKITLRSAFTGNKLATKFEPPSPPLSQCGLLQEQLPCNFHFPTQHCIGGGVGWRREGEVNLVPRFPTVRRHSRTD